jgi:hypothetical protein
LKPVYPQQSKMPLPGRCNLAVISKHFIQASQVYRFLPTGEGMQVVDCFGRQSVASRIGQTHPQQGGPGKHELDSQCSEYAHD